MIVRKRLAVLYTAVLAVLFLFFAVGVYVSFSFHLGKEVDEALAAWSLRILGLEGFDRGVAPDASADLGSLRLGPYGMPDTFVLAFDPDGGLLLNGSSFPESGIAAVRRAAIPEQRGGTRSFRTLVVDGQRYRILFASAADGGGRALVLALGRSLIHVEGSVRGFVGSLVLAWAAALVLGSSLMWVLVGQTIKPVHGMTALASDIARSSDLSARLRVGPEGDEFSELARALNRMLETVEKSHEIRKSFLADASHQLRTPLTSIRANLGFLKGAGGAPPADRDAALRDCISEADRMSRLIGDLLALARAEAPRTSAVGSFDAREALDLEYHAFAAGRDEAPGLEVPDEPLTAVGDREDVRQVLAALLENAAKYSPRGARIGLSARRSGDRIELAVEDEGPGIPEDELSLVFDRFYRGSNVRARVGGSGLGLAIARSILDRAGGTLALENRPSGGLRARVLLPAAKRG